MNSGDELVIGLDMLPEGADVGTIVHLELPADSEGQAPAGHYALLVRQLGPEEALCEVMAIAPTH
ncbi:hypothetical protein C7446_1387 [Kushneria sinocarnis]|uniref:Uncharacterized protein n=1 Tax=Kushneria sinocarnis TaxID=595502 RepID=A0A420WWW5_9GAMM|nr:hypothetical protein [Kushneria sinocarnis]RKR04187.1 hypothetical protein C7446_1387 [Kushneria sinocarnis]